MEKEQPKDSLLVGSRQSGKTTRAKEWLNTNLKMHRNATFVIFSKNSMSETEKQWIGFTKTYIHANLSSNEVKTKLKKLVETKYFRDYLKIKTYVVIDDILFQDDDFIDIFKQIFADETLETFVTARSEKFDEKEKQIHSKILKQWPKSGVSYLVTKEMVHIPGWF